MDYAGIGQQYHADPVRLALLPVGDCGSAEDVVRDVFTRLWAHGREPDHDSALADIRMAVVMPS